MKEIFALISFIIIVAPIIPYAKDMTRGRVKPSRSTRVMFLGLLLLAFFQQYSLGSGLGLALLVGEILGSVTVLLLSIRYGVGGLAKLDIVCYTLLILDLCIWAITKNALLAIFLTMLADMIALLPTVVKTWKDPQSETYYWWLMGVIAPVFGILSEGNFSLQEVLFPVYLLLANLLVVLLIVVPRGASRVKV
jgi:hypothetical protein